jgi:HAD superfamily hydrolase (TIGR01484 family)
MEQKNKHFLGWIALDIDGTITLDQYSVPEPVITFLRECIVQGWRLAIATGRPLTFALMGLEKFDFPYLLLAQNGTIAIQMPSKKDLLKRYIPTSRIFEVEQAFEGTVSDFVVFSGYEHHDQIYWRPQRLDEEQQAYVKNFAKNQGERLIQVASFDEIKLESIPLVKCFGTQIQMRRVAQNLGKTGHFNATILRDPYSEDYYILLITDRSASKGLTLEAAIRMLGPSGIIIAAGDDENDASLLNVADIKIAMAHAPESLTRVAHFIAPPTSEHGIIYALRLALKKNGKNFDN